MRLRIEPPEITFETSGAFHVVRMTIDTGDLRLDSGPQRAASKKTAEQLAAKAVLDEYRSRLREADEITWIEESEGEMLKAENFKGRLLEWSAEVRTTTPPVFERRVVPEGFLIRALMMLPGGRNAASGWFGACAEKTAEHAAARSLLEIFPRHRDGETPADCTADADSSDEHTTRPGRDEIDSKSSGRASFDPRKLLNELRQAGVIHDFGYTLHEQRGPSHMPIFVMEGWALIRKEERIETPRVEAGSKKTAQREAAGMLVARLNRLGLLADPRTDCRD